MYIPQGKVVAVAIIIAIIAQGMGGFLLNQKTVTSCESKFDYQTDVYGAFSGKGQDIPVDFDPRENVTGYYAMDPTDPDSGQEQKRQPAISYNPAKLPNNYPYQRQAVDTASYTLTIESTKALDDYDHVDHYKVTVKDNSKESPTTKNYEWDGAEITKYSGLYHTSIGHITHSYINMMGTVREAPRIMNIGEMMRHIDEIKDKDLTLVLSNGGIYPTILANLDYETDVSLFHRSYIFNYNSEISSYAYVDAGTESTEIHIQNYFVNKSWIVFGSENDGDNKITLTILATTPDQTNMYIDPNHGVSPTHASTEYTTFYDKYYYPVRYSGSFNGYCGLAVDDTFNDMFDMTIKSAQDIKQPESSTEMSLFKMKVEYTNSGQGPMTTPVVNVTIYMQGSETASYTHQFYGESMSREIEFTASWTFTNTRIDFSLEWWNKSVTFDADISGINTIVGQTLQRSTDHPIKIELCTITDTYDPARAPDKKTGSGGGNFSIQSTTYQIEHVQERIPFESDQTYWYNGYNNSTIGMIVSCLPVQGQGGSVPAETRFNLLLHMTDLTDKWCYNNALLPAISVWTDEQTGMVYVGSYNKNGARQMGSAMQVGVCDYAYFELRVVNNALTIWIAPVYQYTPESPFVNYTPETMFDQTASIKGVTPEGSIIKSITMLSFNVQSITNYTETNYTESNEIYDEDVPNQWESGDCTVEWSAGKIIVSGDGAMADYTSVYSVPWRGYAERAVSIQIGEGVTHIGARAFEEFTHAVEIIGLTESGGKQDHISVESIGERAFYNCAKITSRVSLNLPNITSIGTSAFGHCTFGPTLTIGGNIQDIGQAAFYGCYNITTIIFEAPEWNITSIGVNAFHLGTSDHKINVTVYSNGNIAKDKLDGGRYTTFDYKSYLLPLYPRHLISHTVILLDGGGLYKEDATLSLNKSFPNDALTELVINAVVHPGDSLSLITNVMNEESVMEEKVLLTLENDGVDKWIYDEQYYDWWDIQIYYVSNHISAVDIDGQHYSGQMYLEDGTVLKANHVYLHVGKYGLYEDLGEMGIVDGRSDLTIKMNGIWAFSTQYYLGTNVQGSAIAFDDLGTWHWSWNEALVVFSLVMLAVSIVLFYKYGFNIYDILIMGGALALLWVSFQG